MQYVTVARKLAHEVRALPLVVPSNLQRCHSILNLETDRKPPFMATFGCRQDCLIVTLASRPALDAHECVVALRYACKSFKAQLSYLQHSKAKTPLAIVPPRFTHLTATSLICRALSVCHIQEPSIPFALFLSEKFYCWLR